MVDGLSECVTFPGECVIVVLYEIVIPSGIDKDDISLLFL